MISFLFFKFKKDDESSFGHQKKIVRHMRWKISIKKEERMEKKLEHKSTMIAIFLSLFSLSLFEIEAINYFQTFFIIIIEAVPTHVLET